MQNIPDYKPNDVKCDVKGASGSPPEKFSCRRKGLTEIFGEDKTNQITNRKNKEPILS